MKGGHLLLVDASGFAFRAFYSWPPRYRESDGQPIGAILGFMGMVWRMRGAADADQPTHGAAVFDSPGRNFRHDLFPAYKANRDPARRVELDAQMPFMRHAAETLGLVPVEAPGYEADDVIATLCRKATKAGMRTTIVSSDKDFGQLVADGVVEIVDPMAKRRVLAADVERKFGVPPRLVPDVQALAGDTVDGIPGIPGCGLKLAAGLVRRFGSMEGVIENASKCRQPSLRRSLERHGEKARLYRQLTVLRQDVRLGLALGDLACTEVMVAHLEAIMKALGAANLMGPVFGIDRKEARPVPTVRDEWGWWKEELKHPGQRLPVDPQPGYYKRKLVKGGPFVMARIWREADPATGKTVVRCEVGGQARDPLAEWTRLSMAPITAAEFGFEVADADHARKYRPGDPKATPGRSINLLLQPAPCNPRRRRPQ